MKRTKIAATVLAICISIHAPIPFAAAKEGAFALIDTTVSDTLGGTLYRYRHVKTGATVVYNDNQSAKYEFALGFQTPPADSKGANHVLEHALFCGSEKYPIKNIMHYIQNGTSSLILNGVTADDCTYYLINTENKTEYYNMIDVYLNGIFHPLFLSDENIFRQQGIRIEYADGKAQYNGVVYNELRIKNLNTEENSVNFIADKCYRAIYGDTTPACSAGGELDAIKELTYEDVKRVYNTYYVPSNSMTYLSGALDIDKTLDILDGFFSGNDAKAPDISFADTKQIPAGAIQEYNLDGNTKTVDIGFMSSGVPAEASAAERYARDILFEIIKNKMEDQGAEMYISGGNSGGISNLVLILSEIPVANKDAVIRVYGAVLDALAESGIDEAEIADYIEAQERYFYANWENIFTGLMYQDNPTAYTEMHAICEQLKHDKAYFAEILKKYFTNNPYQVVIVSGNGSFGSEDSSVSVSAEELERIRHETEAFRRWNDAEDDPAAVEKIPFLTLDEVADAPDKAEPSYEEQNGISFYFTPKDSGEACLYFPLAMKEADFSDVQLMYYFLQSQANALGASFYTMIAPFEQAGNPQEIHPHFCIGLSDENAAETLKEVVDFLHSADTWDADDLAAYIKTAPQAIYGSYYDPYLLSAALKGSALSAGGRFGYVIPQNTIVKGSPHYYHLLQGLNPDDAPAMVQRLKDLAQELLLDSKPVVGYTGTSEGYDAWKNAVVGLFADGKTRESTDLLLPAGCNNAAVVTKLADANHFMLAATYDERPYSGKMAVLGKVLSTKYITPTMRGKHGAYGCNITFYNDSMVAGVAGLADVDLALEIWQGMGAYLRSLQMTQRELDAFIVSAVQEYDAWEYTASESGANFALCGKSAADCEQIRNEMLSVTVEDLKGYADFVDALAAQQRVFAVLGKSAADSAAFEFSYYANADTLTVVPRLQKNPGAYIKGKTDTAFAPDADITRAEAAALIGRILSDKRGAQGASPFSDVAQTDWYYEAVVSLAEKEIFNGYGDGRFLPDMPMSRAEFASVLAGFIYEEEPAGAMQFEDVTEHDWFYRAVAKMTANGYVSGYENNCFYPNRPVTRAEAVTILNRMMGIDFTDDMQNPFADARNHWAARQITAAVNG